jgi:hypothetical protein
VFAFADDIMVFNRNLIDTENDGLSDFEEVRLYNTNPLLVDTDNDGLSDYEEVKIYNSDPNNVDSDGDGFNDGLEINGNYNPMGTGKLNLDNNFFR